ncbi:large ribosomal subunit protein bL33m isoform X1 [Anopheles gambiae]|uniref:large ribosomal subunit protein bL33m isoform X1 n=1 Tax=Anopheles gambiae TaxID=7165 RepID=UPI002AC93798|nr:large ribosomal subunit protein bL33m isoform X1 [Anopheles gambiae]
MFITNILLKKAKSKNILVLMESAVSGHQFTMIRERLADKLELQRFDPYSKGPRSWGGLDAGCSITE